MVDECKKCKFDKINVYISGYGPFMGVSVNPTETLVNTIMSNKDEIEKVLENSCVLLHSHIYEVSCSYVDENLPKCHSLIEAKKELNELHLIIHFGVYANSSNIHLEMQCDNFIMDYVSKCQKISDDDNQCIQCKLNVKEICEELKSGGHNCEISEDAGRYLCNYIYYKSSKKFMEQENVIPIFIHIPYFTVCSLEDCYKFFVDFLKSVKSRYC